MSSNSIDTLIKLSAPSTKPAASASARDEAEQFDSYLRQATESAAPEPATKPQPTAKTAKEESAAVSTGEQDATASSDDEGVPTEVTEQAEVSPEETNEVVEEDEVLISVAAATLVAQPEIVPNVEITTSELTADLSAETPTAAQSTPNAEGSVPAADQKTPAATVPTVFKDLLPVTASDAAADAATIPNEQVATSLVTAKPSAQSIADEADAADQEPVSQEPQVAPIKTTSETAAVAAPAVTERQRDDRENSKSSEQDTAVTETPIEVPQPAESVLPDLVSDTDKSTGGNEKIVGVSSPTSQFGHQNVSQTASALSGNTESHASRGEGESQTPTIDRARFVQRVTNAFRAAQQNDGHIQLRLSPPELGQLRIEIAVRNGVLSANLETETADARRVLLDNLPALRQRLAEQDIRIDKFEVDIRREGGQPDGQAGAQDRQAEQNTQRASAQNRIRTSQTPDVVSTRMPRAMTTAVDAGLDVRI